MNTREVKENLCIYDKRNPDNECVKEYERPKNCSCDNCFYGRHELAEEILKLWRMIG